MSVRIEGLTKHFPNGKRALNNVGLQIEQGEMVALIGASGSGKSTLLRHIAGLMPSDAVGGACIEVNGRCVQRAGRIEHSVRNTRSGIGFVFQQFNLVDRLPVLVNVLVGRLHRMPWWRALVGWFTPQERALALKALDRVGIAECHAQRASTLSGGQQQRAAIARTLVQGARVVLADEPIASLDPESSRNVMEILQRICQEDGCTVIVSLHQVEMARRYCSRVVALRDGQVVFDGPSSQLTTALLRDLYGMQADDLLGVDAQPSPSNVSHLPQASAPSWQNPVAKAA